MIRKFNLIRDRGRIKKQVYSTFSTKLVFPKIYSEELVHCDVLPIKAFYSDRFWKYSKLKPLPGDVICTAH